MATNPVDALEARPSGLKRRIFGAAAGGTSIAAGLCALAISGMPLAMINSGDTAAKIMGSIFGAIFSVSGMVLAAGGLIAGIAGFFSGRFGGRLASAAGLVASGFGLQLSLHLLDRING